MTQRQIDNLKVGDLYKIGTNIRLIVNISFNKNRNLKEIDIVDLSCFLEPYTFEAQLQNWDKCKLLT